MASSKLLFYTRPHLVQHKGIPMAGSQWAGRWRVAALVGVLVVLGTQARAAEDAAEARMRRDVTFLASDACEGRGITTKGINLAADYVAAEFKKAGLKPAPPGNSYFQ